MPPKRSTHLDRILGRVEDLDEVSLQVLVQRLARERALLETVFNTIREGILVVEPDGTIVYANEAAHRLVGLKLKDVGEAKLWKVVPDLARTLNLNLRETERERAVVSRELEITYPERKYVRLYMVPFDEPEGGGDGERRYALILSDITEEKTTHEERIENEKLASIFMLAGGVAHEIGNPLNSINIHLQLIKRQLGKLDESAVAEKIGKSVEVCANEVDRLDGIITHFLQAIRPQDPDFQDIDIFELLEEVLNVQASEMEDLGIQVDVVVEERPPVILGDRNQLKQVLFNVIKNAMEAMDRGGELRVTSRGDDEFVYLYLADTGVGIKGENMARVFDPYYTTKESGSGLGMMIVQRIMREHGGQIGLDSKPDEGTVVTLQFPQKHRRIRMLES